MKKSDHQFLFLKDFAKLLVFIFTSFPHIKVTLSWAERNDLVQAALKKSGVSNTLKSFHLHRLAVDIIFYYNGEYLDPAKRDTWLPEVISTLEVIGKYWETLSSENRWGGRFKSLFDPNHFERYIEKYIL